MSPQVSPEILKLWQAIARMEERLQEKERKGGLPRSNSASSFQLQQLQNRHQILSDRTYPHFPKLQVKFHNNQHHHLPL